MTRRDEYDDKGDHHDPDRYEDDRPAARGDDRGYDDGEEGYDDYEEAPRRGGRARARERVSMPAIFLMIVGGLGLVFAVVRTIIDLTVGADQGPGPFGNNNPAFKDVQKVAMILGPILNVIWGLIVFFGGLQMKRLQSRGFVLFSCIWAMLPCSLCCLLGLPFGIWALVVVNDESVKRAF